MRCNSGSVPYEREDKEEFERFMRSNAIQQTKNLN
jgi:hypothetical protein